MVVLTGRDEAMLEWLRTVRFADSEAVRFALAGFTDGDDVDRISVRRAQWWMVRMEKMGLVERDRLNQNSPYVVWPSFAVTGQRAPTLWGQTMRHELAVAVASGRYLARGYRWTRDRRPVTFQDHQGDGVAIRDGVVDLVEVELTPKMTGRYRGIFANHAERLTSSTVSRVVYLCTADAARMVLREADKHLFRDLRPRVVALPVFDRHGNWTGADDAAWAEHLMAPAPARVPAPELWDQGIA